MNYGRFASPSYDALVARAQAAKTIAERNAIWREAEAEVVADHAVVPLYTLSQRSLVDPRIENWLDNPRNIHQTRYLRLRTP